MSTPFAVMAGPSRKCGLWVAALWACAGCNIDNPGITPPEAELNFPLPLTLSRPDDPAAAPEWLYVANTNSNFRFNSGSVQSFDLERVDRALERPTCVDYDVLPQEDLNRNRCGARGGTFEAGEGEEPGQCCIACLEVPRSVLCDGRDDPLYASCCINNLDRFVPEGGDVRTASFASGMVLSSGGEALYLSIRGNDSLLRIEVGQDGSLECGQGRDRRCAEPRYESIEAPLADTEAELAPLPAAIASGSPEDFGVSGGGELIFTGHEDGTVSFFVDDGGGPELRATLPSVGGRISTIRSDPTSQLLYVTQEQGPLVSRIGVAPVEEELAPFYSSPLVVTGLVNDNLSRDIAFDEDDPDRLYVLVRGSPTPVRAVYFLDRDPEVPGEAHTVDVARVGAGPARLAQVDINGNSYLFVTCFDDRAMYIFDTETRQLIGFVRGLIGPIDFAVDAVRERAYIADFSSSTLRVADLRGLSDPSLPSPRIVLTLGELQIEGNDL